MLEKHNLEQNKTPHWIGVQLAGSHNNSYSVTDFMDGMEVSISHNDSVISDTSER